MKIREYIVHDEENKDGKSNHCTHSEMMTMDNINHCCVKFVHDLINIYIFVKWVFMSKTFTQLFIINNRHWQRKYILMSMAIDGIEIEVIKEMLSIVIGTNKANYP